jgi:predicted glycogen debranching enzyme
MPTLHTSQPERALKRPRDGGQDGVMPRREWLVTNGLGGYASGTVAGVVTRRYHGLLVASLPAPLGRVVMLNHLLERVRLPDRRVLWLGDEDEVAGPNASDRTEHLAEFRLELGLPVWVYTFGGVTIEKRIVMPHGQNTAHVSYRLVAGDGPVRLSLRPSVNFRSYEAPVNVTPAVSYTLSASGYRYELSAGNELPCLRMLIYGDRAALTLEERGIASVPYEMEASRGYDASGTLWSPGYFRADLQRERAATIVASTEPWETVQALPPEEADALEQDRRRRLLLLAGAAASTPLGAELVLAADQFIVTPAGRVEEASRA